MKVSNGITLPPELALALAEAENVLKRHDTLAAVMVATGSSIPTALAQERELAGKLGAAEIAGEEGADKLRAQLDAVKERREGDARRRQSASKGLLALEAELTKARKQVTQVQAAFVSTVIQDFGRRWVEACHVLAALRGEASQLTAALGVPCPTAAPYVVSVNAATGASELKPVALAEALPWTALPPPVATVAAMLAKLNDAGLISELRQAEQLNLQHQALSRLAGQPTEMGGTYIVSRTFHALGSDFPAGTLLDDTVMSVGMLHRFWRGNALRPAGGAAVEAA